MSGYSAPMSPGNVEIVQRLYEAINRVSNDGRADRPTFELITELFDPDVELQQLADIAGTAGTFRGYAGLVQSQAELNAHLVDIRFEPKHYLEHGDSVVVDVWASATARESGVRTRLPLGHLWVLKAGRVVRWVVYRSPEEALEGARGREGAS